MLNSIKITVTSPFENGGFVKILDGTKQVLPAIFLSPLPRVANGPGLPHSKKMSYELLFQRGDLPYVSFDEEPNWTLVEGCPKESVSVEIVTEF